MENLDYSVVIATMGSDKLEGIVRTFLEANFALEVIVVLDNPKIDPGSFLSPATLKHGRVVLINNEVNIGLTKSLNKAISKSKGKFIIRSDDDDISTPNRVEKINEYFNANPNVDIVCSYAEGIDVSTNKKWLISSPLTDTEIKTKLLDRNFIVHSSIAFRKSRLALINFYDEAFRYAQDYDLYLRAIRANFTFGCIPEVLVTRLYHKDSITVSNRKWQILHSMAARLLHVAQTKDAASIWPVIIRYVLLLIIPNWARNLRRKIGFGK